MATLLFVALAATAARVRAVRESSHGERSARLRCIRIDQPGVYHALCASGTPGGAGSVHGHRRQPGRHRPCTPRSVAHPADHPAAARRRGARPPHLARCSRTCPSSTTSAPQRVLRPLSAPHRSSMRTITTSRPLSHPLTSHPLMSHPPSHPLHGRPHRPTPPRRLRWTFRPPRPRHAAPRHPPCQWTVSHPGPQSAGAPTPRGHRCPPPRPRRQRRVISTSRRCTWAGPDPGRCGGRRLGRRGSGRRTQDPDRGALRGCASERHDDGPADPSSRGSCPCWRRGGAKVGRGQGGEVSGGPLGMRLQVAGAGGAGLAADRAGGAAASIVRVGQVASETSAE
jgi:hypothetical protein